MIFILSFMLVIFKKSSHCEEQRAVVFKIECRVNESVGSFIQHVCIEYLIVIRYYIYIDGGKW